MTTEPINEQDDEAPKGGIPFRKNVLALMGIAYGVLLVIFVVVAVSDSPQGAHDLIRGPFVALIGGTLALAKDLVK